MIAGFVLIFATCSHGDCVADRPVTDHLYSTQAKCEKVRHDIAPIYSDNMVCGEVYRVDSKKMAGILPAG